MNNEPIIGCLLGTAVGDSLGLPWENLSEARIQKWLRPPLEQSFFLGRGMVSDDTEHACLTARALLSAGPNPEAFAGYLGWALRWWFLSLPGGIGFATLRACLKLWMGFSPASSGVYSAGNGPAMRAPILGVLHGHDLPLLKSLVRVSTIVTHTDPKAEEGALFIALLAHFASTFQASTVDPREVFPLLKSRMELSPEFLAILEKAAKSAMEKEPTGVFIASIGSRNGISGYMYHTVAGVFHTWARHPADFPAAMEEIIGCGGDTDSTAALLGGIIGASVGQKGIPEKWINTIFDWPWGPSSITFLGKALAEGRPTESTLIIWPLVFFRNILFISIVLSHGFRRLLPPY